MTQRFTVAEVKAWLEPTKLQHPNSLDDALAVHAENEVIARIAVTYDPTTWIDDATTPSLVQTIMSKLYSAWYYERVYSEDIAVKESPWVSRLLANVEVLIMGIVAGNIIIPELGPSDINSPLYYPNDSSSAQDPADNNFADTSLGPSRFSMGQVF
jgi:hypothetical protein